MQMIIYSLFFIVHARIFKQNDRKAVVFKNVGAHSEFLIEWVAEICIHDNEGVTA